MNATKETIQRHGIVIQETVRGCKCQPFTAFSSDDMGRGFHDLTDGMRPGQASGWDEFDEGQCHHCGRKVSYREMLVVTHATTVREETEFA